jgi:hypothetical protein
MTSTRYLDSVVAARSYPIIFESERTRSSNRLNLYLFDERRLTTRAFTSGAT